MEAAWDRNETRRSFGENKNVVHTHKVSGEFRVNAEKSRWKRTNKKILIISVVRNLFDRNISHFFQQLSERNPDKGKWLYNYAWYDACPLEGSLREFENIARDYYVTRRVRGECRFDLASSIREPTLDQEELCEHFSIFNKIQSKKLENWFDNLNSVLNTNVFDKPFDFKEKYSIHTTGNVTILTLRFEDIQYWQSVFDKIFIQSPILEEKNRSSEKWYSDMYRQFKKDYKYSKDDIDLMSNMDWTKFYYKKDELDSIIKKYK